MTERLRPWLQHGNTVLRRALVDAATVMTLMDEDEDLQDQFAAALAAVRVTFARGGKLLACGCGGSAAQAQHLVGELVGRFEAPNRPALPAIALTADGGILTAVMNDWDSGYTFVRQVEALCTEADVIVCYSTSGASPAVVGAARVAVGRGALVIGMTGIAESELGKYCTHGCLRVPSAITAIVQEGHVVLTHALVRSLEESME
jgi:D-sedoheptulose 7-phosphate isomerase